MKGWMGVLLVASAGVAEESYRTVTLPGPAAAPDACVDAEGALHAVYVVEGALWYRRSADGAAWTEPQQLGEHCHARAEMGPRLASGPGGTLACVWTGGATWATVSRDGGKSWAASNPAGPDSGEVENPAVASDGKGGFVAVWVESFPGQRVELRGTTFAKGAAAWSAPRAIPEEDFPICPCCAPAMATDGNGRIYLALRSISVGNAREIEVLTSDDGGTAWARNPVSQDRWVLTTCPAAGPGLAVSADGKTIALAWRFKDAFRSAVSRDSGKTFARADFDDGATTQDFVRLGIGAKGRILAAWTRGGTPKASLLDSKVPLAEAGAAIAASSPDGPVLLRVEPKKK